LAGEQPGVGVMVGVMQAPPPQLLGVGVGVQLLGEQPGEVAVGCGVWVGGTGVSVGQLAGEQPAVGVIVGVMQAPPPQLLGLGVGVQLAGLHPVGVLVAAGVSVGAGGVKQTAGLHVVTVASGVTVIQAPLLHSGVGVSVQLAGEQPTVAVGCGVVVVHVITLHSGVAVGVQLLGEQPTVAVGSGVSVAQAPLLHSGVGVGIQLAGEQPTVAVGCGVVVIHITTLQSGVGVQLAGEQLPGMGVGVAASTATGSVFMRR
jgi:hypothetical protein